MLLRWFQAFGLCILLATSCAVFAQLDSSAAILLRSSGHAPSRKSLDSSRYKVRAPESRKQVDDDVDESPGTYIPSPVPKAATKVSPKSAAQSKPSASPPPESPAPEPAPVSVQPSLPAPVQPAANPPPPMATPVEEKPPVTVQVKELILGGTEEDIDEAKKAIHPEDPRSNIIGISIAPAYFYNGSSSNFSYRNYHSDGPGLGLGMNLWFTPFFGLESKYFTSVSSGVKDGANMVSAGTSEFSAGIRFRRHFGYTRKSAQLSWGIDYHDAGTKISTDATSVVGHKTSGLSVSLEGEIPSSATHSHLFEVAIRPSQHHSENSTGADARSGTKNESNEVMLSLGGQWTLDRHDQVFWKAQYSVERNLFNGEASKVDPKTGSTPDGVSVTNNLLIFYFGFKWGS